MPRGVKTIPGLAPETPDWFKLFVSVHFQSLVMDVQESKDLSTENSRAIKGFNGESGLIGKFLVMEEKFSFMNKKVEDALDTAKKILLFLVTLIISLLVYNIFVH
jgi:hypothetical protein